MRKLSVILLLLSGCTANGPPFNEASIPKGDGANIVIYRKHEFYGSTQTIPIEINGKPACSIHDTGFAVYNVNAGDTAVTASAWGAPGISRVFFQTDAGKTYYVSVKYNDTKANAQMAAGLIGMLIAEGAVESTGPFDLDLRDVRQANKDLLQLKQDCI